MFPNISKGGRLWAMLFLITGIGIAAFGFIDNRSNGDGGGNFVLAGIFAVISLGIAFFDNRKHTRRKAREAAAKKATTKPGTGGLYSFMPLLTLVATEQTHADTLMRLLAIGCLGLLLFFLVLVFARPPHLPDAEDYTRETDKEW